ncbi:hypothetical protein PAMP_021105 [Pampus punctatissimus]
MIIAILLSCFTITVSPVPVSPNVIPSPQSPQPVEATNQKPEAQTLTPRSPCKDQPQPVVPQQQNPQHGYQFLPSLQHFTWPPIGGSPLLVPHQQSVQGSQPASQPSLQQSYQQPLVFAPYGFFPLFSLPYRDQQNPQIVYMLQQPMNSRLGGLSSEELEMAAKLGQMGVYMQTALTNPPARAIQPNPGKPEALPSEGTSLPGAQQTQRRHQEAGSMANGVPVGWERPAQEVMSVQTPA